MISTLAVAGYRSLRELSVSLGNLTVITGPNGSGKSNLYRALRLLVSTAHGNLHAALAEEGGFSSALWAGPEKVSRRMKRGEAPIEGSVRSQSVALKLGFRREGVAFAIDLGLPKPDSSAFNHDPEIKREILWVGETIRPKTIIADRRGPSVMATDGEGQAASIVTNLARFDSMMTHAVEPRRTPELLILRETMRTWRFYDHFRVDSGAPVRQPQIGTHSPVLAAGGGNLAPAVQTIHEIGDREAFDQAIEDAFPGMEIAVDVNEMVFDLMISQKGMLRPLKTRELSDGTLRYLLLTAALLSPRPPELLVLNEPESSLHTDLLAPLGRLIVQAAASSQVIVVTHSKELSAAMAAEGDVHLVELEKRLGETIVAEDVMANWKWPPR